MNTTYFYYAMYYMLLNDIQKKCLIELINSGQQIPEDFKYLLFPTTHEEYELTYAGKMRKEDIIAGEDGTLPVPLQVERIFNGKEHLAFEDGWRNMIVFGDNLQLLKTINENKDPLIKDKIKGKVKLIYIDPPFATQDEFVNKDGAKAYSDKKKGSEFLEFIRRRLILAKEILSDDGSIYVHLDEKMVDYLKIIMDEVFGKNNYRRQIIWFTKTSSGFKSKAENWIRGHDVILYYTKTQKFVFNKQFYLDYKKEYLERFKKIDENGRKYRDDRSNGKKQYLDELKGIALNDVWDDIMSFQQASTSTEILDYPTQKPEELLARIIKASTNEGDLVMDFFGGSGTTMAVAEKLGRKWITCDLGKLSYLTMQKRILLINEGKDLLDKSEKNKKYNKPARSFITCKLGLYDLKQTLNLEWDKYKSFVAQLFEIDLKKITISGMKFDGEKRGFPVKIFDYIKHKNSAVDQNYINDLHTNIKTKRISRVYIVAPATRVHYIADYEEIDDTRYYFLKVPYKVIEELHKTQFTKLRQPRNKYDVNDIEEMKGFHFIYTPEVECKLKKNGSITTLFISKFLSNPLNGCSQDNFSTLSSIFVNYSYNGKEFLMDDVRFWNQIESTKKAEKDTKIKEKDGTIECVEWDIPTKLLGDRTVFIFIDIYGNDVTVSLTKEN